MKTAAQKKYKSGIAKLNAIVAEAFAEKGADFLVARRGEGYYYWTGTFALSYRVESICIFRLDPDDCYRDGANIVEEIARNAITEARALLGEIDEREDSEVLRSMLHL